jgi:hypothetical protein
MEQMEPNWNTSTGRALLTTKDLNEQNRRFWQTQSDLLEKRMSDELLFNVATMDMRSETLRQVPIYSQKTLEQALADAEKTKNTFQSDFSRKGGKAPKCDALQSLIRRIVHRKPNINNQQLLYRLKKEIGEGTVVSIEGKSEVLADGIRKIHFQDRDGTPKTASLSGLKDRLSRVKKNIRAKRQTRERAV